MLTADNLAKYLYYQVFQKYETKYVFLKYAFKQPDAALKKYRDNIAIIGTALLSMLEEGEYH